MKDSLTVIAPAELVRQSTDIAGLCKEIVVRTAKQIGNRKFVPVEGWTSIATAHGCVPTISSVSRTETGFVAVAELRRMSDNLVIARAEGFVGDDEETWSKRHEYARRAMAQTRAMSRVCRTAFAHVVVMMNAGLETTPAEEMGDADREHAASANGGVPVIATHVHFGKNKGVAVADLNTKQLNFYRKNFEDQEQAGKKQSDSDRALYAAVMARLQPQPELPSDDGKEHPKREELRETLIWNKIDLEKFVEAAKDKKLIPHSKMTFEQMPEAVAARLLENYESIKDYMEDAIPA